MDINISQVLTEARSHLPDIRKNAERTLEKLACQDFYQFLMILANELSNEEKLKENRQLAATIIKNMIIYLETQKNLWLNYPEEKSSNIKSAILGSLASNVKEVRRTAGHTIAGNILKEIFNF